jgi:hypothetical protein
MGRDRDQQKGMFFDRLIKKGLPEITVKLMYRRKMDYGAKQT